MGEKEIWGLLSVFIGFLSYWFYIAPILKRETKPHAFTWLVWSLSESIAFFAQCSRGAGTGAWVTGLSAAASFSVMIMALLWGEKNITRGDWIALMGGLLAIPLWYFTRNPLGAVILVSLIDSSAYYPTFRKSYTKPWEEPAFSYLVGSGKYAASLLAMQSYSLVTALYPSCIVFMNILLIAMLLSRRAALARVTK